MAKLNLTISNLNESNQRQEQYMRSLGISLEEVKDQNEELIEGNNSLKKQNKNIQRKLGIAVEDRAPQPEDESKRERFVLLKRNDPEFMGYYTIRAQDSYTTRKLKVERVHFPNLVVLLDFKCSPNSKTLYTRIKETLKAKNVVFKSNNIDLENSQIDEQDLIEEMKVINDAKRDI
jgi:regulator of replication initiation timing